MLVLGVCAAGKMLCDLAVVCEFIVMDCLFDLSYL